MPATLVLLLGIFVILLCNIFVLYVGQRHIVSDSSDLNPAQVIIVLGAGVSDEGVLSPVFRERLDMGISLYEEGKAEKILISGDNSNMLYNEVIPARQYLLDHGIPESSVFVDYAGFSTYDTMYRALVVFDVESAIVVTQSFHLSRAVVLAEVFGIEVEGMPASVHLTTMRNNIREIVARVKAVGDILIGRKPKYLGETIPITGDGRDTIEDA